MADNTEVASGSGVAVATDQVTHSGDANKHVQLVRSVWTYGTEGSKAVIDDLAVTSSEYYTTAAQTDDFVIPAQTASLRIVVTCITVLCSAANTVNTSVRIGFGTASVPTQGASGADGVAKVILSHPGIAPGSGVIKGTGAGIVGVGAVDDDLRITCSVPTGGSLTVQVDWHTAT